MNEVKSRRMKDIMSVSHGYRNYIRCENIKAILDCKYKAEYSYLSYYSSKNWKIWNEYYENRCPICGHLGFISGYTKLGNKLEPFEGCYRCHICGYKK
jgi:hypothetical protein